MALTPEQKQMIIQKARNAREASNLGDTANPFIDEEKVNNQPLGQDASGDQSELKEKLRAIAERSKPKQSSGPLDFIKDTFTGTVEAGIEGLKLAKDAQIASFKGEQDPLSTGIQTVGGIATTAVAPVAGAFSAFLEQIPDTFKEKVSKKAGKAFQDVVTVYSQKYEKLKEEDPEFADKLKQVVSSPVTKRNVSGLLGIVDLLDVGLARKAVKPATDIGEKAIKQFQANRVPKLAEKALKKATKTYKKHSPDTKKVIKARQAYEKKYGVSVDEDLAKNQVVFETDATGKFYNTKGQAAELLFDAKEEIAPVMNQQIETYKDNTAGSIQTLMERINERIKKSVGSGESKRKIERVIKRELQTRANTGYFTEDGFFNVGKADEMKKGAWDEAYTKELGSQETETVTKRAYRILGQELNKMIDEAVDDPLYKAVNREWGRMQSLAEYLDKINETKIKGGRLGKDLDRLIATVAFSNAGAIPAFVGGEAFSLLKQYINNPERVTAEVVSKLRKQGILPDYVLTLQQAKDYLLKVKQAREQTLKLPAPSQTTPAVIIPPAPTVIEPPAKKIRMAEPKEQLLLPEGKDIQLPSAERQALKRSREKISTPDEAFGAIAGVEQDEEGNITFNPVKGALGAVGLGVAKKSGALKKATQMTDDLIKEAKKYKSAEEFVESQAKYFRGGSKIVDEFVAPAGNGGALPRGASEAFGRGIYLTTEKNFAERFGKEMTEAVVNPNAKLWEAVDQRRKITKHEAKQFNKALSQIGGDAEKILNAGGFKESDPVEFVMQELQREIFDGGDFSEIFKKAGYDGIRYKETHLSDVLKKNKRGGNEVVIFNPDQIKTKSQLKEIWNKANRKLVPRSKKD